MAAPGFFFPLALSNPIASWLAPLFLLSPQPCPKVHIRVATLDYIHTTDRVLPFPPGSVPFPGPGFVCTYRLFEQPGGVAGSIPSNTRSLLLIRLQQVSRRWLDANLIKNHPTRSISFPRATPSPETTLSGPHTFCVDTLLDPPLPLVQYSQSSKHPD